MNSVSIFEMLHGEMLEVLKGNTSAQSALQRPKKGVVNCGRCIELIVITWNRRM